MKKQLLAALVAATLLWPASAQAVDVTVHGLWDFGFQYGEGSTLTRKDRAGNNVYGWKRSNPGKDNFAATQRLRTIINFRASEYLSGSVFFKIASSLYTDWGDASKGAALGTDGTQVAVKWAYLDWTVPNTKLKLRMGLQAVTFPSFTGQSTILDNCVAGITANYRVNDNFGITGLWLRPFNDNYGGNNNGAALGSGSAGFLDNIDLFALFLPISGDGFKVTPWGGYGMVGKNAKLAPANVHNFYQNPNMKREDFNKMDAYGSTFMAGLTGEVTALDPFRFAWEFTYAGMDSGKERYNRKGWTASLLSEYKMDWGTPGLYGWYTSGEDDSAANGSERIMQFSVFPTNNDFSTVAFNGAKNDINRESLLGMTFAGTWGVGGRIKDLSVMEDLKHTLRLVYIHGTNEKKGVANIVNGTSNIYVNPAVNEVLLTKAESAVEVSMSTEYKIYKNLTLYSELGYLFTNRYDYSFRGKESRCDGWNASLIFEYGF